MDPATLLSTVALPALLVLVLGFCARLARGRVPWLGSGAVPALALALVVVLACRAQNGGIPWPPRIAFESLPWVAVAAGAVAALLRGGAPTLGGGELGLEELGVAARAESAVAGGVGPSRGSVIAAVAAALVGLACLRLPGGSHEARLAGFAATIVGCVLASRACAVPGPSAPLAVWGTAACLAGLGLLAGIAKLALIAGALSAGGAALALLALMQRPLALGAAGAAVWSATLGAGALLGMAYDEAGTPVAAWWLVAAAPAGMALAGLPGIARRPRWSAVVRAGAPMVLAGAGLAMGAVATLRTVENAEDETPHPYSTLSAVDAGAPADAPVSVLAWGEPHAPAAGTTPARR
jgi:hypothetical protein